MSLRFVRPFLTASISGPSLRPITHCVVRTVQTLDDFVRPMTVLAERHIASWSAFLRQQFCDCLEFAPSRHQGLVKRQTQRYLNLKSREREREREQRKESFDI